MVQICVLALKVLDTGPLHFNTLSQTLKNTAFKMYYIFKIFNFN